MGEVERGVDESDMRERLGKVAEHLLGGRVVLLCEQTDVVAEGQHPVGARINE